MKYLNRFNESNNTFNTLKEILLNYGGIRVVETYEEDLDKLIDRGMFFNCDSTLVKMRDSRCHFNASNFWNNYTDKHGRDSAYICTGWALSDDDTWRQHSWVWLQDNDSIVETTEPREAYYGFILSAEECDKFYWDNY